MLYDRAKGESTPLFVSQPSLLDYKFAHMEDVRIKARDGLEHWTLTPTLTLTLTLTRTPDPNPSQFKQRTHKLPAGDAFRTRGLVRVRARANPNHNPNPT